MAKGDLYFSKPLMNAAGALGFAPDARAPLDWQAFGAFVTSPISWGARTPAHGERFVPYSGGFLLHTGLPNPGFSQTLKRYARRWASAALPVLVHLIAIEGDTLARMVERLEACEGVAGIEVGLPPEADVSLATQATQAAGGELPVIIHLPLETCRELAPVVIDVGASAVSLAAPRGTLRGADGHWHSGRLYGPSVFPLALGAVRDLAAAGIPVIGAGGVYSLAAAEAMLAAGALAVQFDARLWQGLPLETA